MRTSLPHNRRGYVTFVSTAELRSRYKWTTVIPEQAPVACGQQTVLTKQQQAQQRQLHPVFEADLPAFGETFPAVDLLLCLLPFVEHLQHDALQSSQMEFTLATVALLPDFVLGKQP